MKLTDCSKKRAIVLVVTVILGIVGIGFIFLHGINIELRPLSRLPQNHKSSSESDEILYYMCPIRIKFPLNMPVTIENIELKDRDNLPLSDESPLIYIYDAEGESKKAGAGIISLEEVQEEYPTLQTPDRLWLYTTESYIVVLLPEKELGDGPYELVMQYSWLGFLTKESSVLIEYRTE